MGLQRGSRGGFLRDLNALRLDASANVGKSPCRGSLQEVVSEVYGSRGSKGSGLLSSGVFLGSDSPPPKPQKWVTEWPKTHATSPRGHYSTYFRGAGRVYMKLPCRRPIVASLPLGCSGSPVSLS